MFFSSVYIKQSQFLEYKQRLKNATDTITKLHKRIDSLTADNFVTTNTNLYLQQRIDHLDGIINEQKKIIKKQSGKLVLSFKYV